MEVPDMPAIEHRLTTLWSKRDTLIERLRAVRFMEIEPDVPAGMEPETVKTPIAYQIIERMVGTITGEKLWLQVPQAKEGERFLQQSSKMEKWTTAAMAQLMKQTGDDVIERFVESLLADGWGVMRLQYTPQLWGDYPKRDKDEGPEEFNKRAEDWKRGRVLPITWTWVDPLNVYPLWSDGRLEAVLEVDRRDPITLNPNRWNLAKKHPELWELAKKNGGDSSYVKFSQLWTRDTVTYAVNDVVVHHKKIQGGPPYIVRYGIGTSTSEPDKKGLSILYPLKDILPYLDRLLSQMGTAIRLWCWPTPVFKQSEFSPTQDVSGQPAERAVDLRPGETVTLYRDEELSWMTWEGNAPDMKELLSLILTIIERAGISEAMYGSAGAGDSGYLISQLIAAARTKFKPIVEHAQSGIEEAVQKLWDIIEYEVKEDLPLYADKWITLGPDDLKGYRQVQVKLNPILPTDAYARSSKAINEVQAKLRSVQSAMEEIGIQHPDEEMDRILIDEWKQDQQVRAFIIQQAMERQGVKMEQQKQMPTDQLMAILPQLPPALQAAIMSTMQAQMPESQVMMAPNQQATPNAPTMPTLGRQVRPSGIGTGMAPGPQARGME